MKNIKFLFIFALVSSLLFSGTMVMYALELEDTVEVTELGNNRRQYSSSDGTELTVRVVEPGDTTDHTISGDYLIVEEGYVPATYSYSKNQVGVLGYYSAGRDVALWVLDQIVGWVFEWGVKKAVGTSAIIAEKALWAAVAVFGSPAAVISAATVAVYIVAASIILYDSYKYKRRLNNYGCIQYMPNTNWVCMQRQPI